MTRESTVGSRRGQDQRPLFKGDVRSHSANLASGIEKALSVPFVAQLALKEKQIQQNVRPVIAVHKWFARRPGTLFRAILLSEFADPPLAAAYFAPHQLRGIRVADPFMGGGTPLLEANRLGCDVLGWDVNPMAYWIVRQEIKQLDLTAYDTSARVIGHELEKELGTFYRTRCRLCGDECASVKYFIWVKSILCETCGTDIRLLPGHVLVHAGRHPRNVVICGNCGELAEVDDLETPGSCGRCGDALRLLGNAGRGRCTCPRCGDRQTYPIRGGGPPAHRMVAIEYHCQACRPKHRGRFLKAPDLDDINRYASAEQALLAARGLIIPNDRIPAGDETARLHRWGYERYREMFNARQLLGLGTLGRLIRNVEVPDLRHALATNLSDLVRYQNMACRYDARALKSLDIFSVHGFPVGLLQCESNVFGIQRPGTRTNIGSGGWSNIVEKFLKAKKYCEHPFETRYERRRKRIVPMPGEWIGEQRNDSGIDRRVVELRAVSSTRAAVPDGSLDAVITDPPYFANVQYAELMDFCYVWLRQVVTEEPSFEPETTRNADELTGNVTLGRDIIHFTAGLSAVYRRMARALKTGRPFVFTYHHNAVDAYYPIAVALLDAGLACTASIPCPAEMSGSIHIHGTDSSIVDTVFVCRATGRIARSELADKASAVADLVRRDVGFLLEGGVRVTRGDVRCVAYGHLIRMAVWKLRVGWESDSATDDKLGCVGRAVDLLGAWAGVEQVLGNDGLEMPRRVQTVREGESIYDGTANDDVCF